MLDNIQEVWKDIKGYEGLYQISNTGKVWSIKSQKCLTPDTSNGYGKVILYAKNGKGKKEYIHRLVGLMFVPNPDNKPQINHKDADKLNNNALNLEWVTQTENNAEEHRMNSIRKRVRCVETGEIYSSIKEAAASKGIKSAGKITEVCQGKRKTTGGYHWCYEY